MPHSIDIYRRADLLITIKPDSTSVQNTQVCGDNFIQLDFKLGAYVKFQIDDWCTVFDQKYYVVENTQPVTKIGRYEYRYSLKLKAEAHLLEKIMYLGLSSNNELREPEFSLMGDAQTFVDLILSNFERSQSEQVIGWASGQVLPTDYKLLTFSSDSCLSALSKVAQAFETEWWISDKKISLTKKGTDTGITLKHGRARGLYEILRQAAPDTNIVTRVWPYGGKKNIPYDYGSERLMVKIRGTIFLNGQTYEILTDYFQQNTSTYGVIEQTVIFDDIYPHRTGTVTAVDATDPFKFFDVAMDFDLNDYLMPGMSAKVAFNTGQLAGYQFEIQNYNHGTKEVKMLKNTSETALDVPSDSLRPAIGDEYVFVDIKLPTDYVIDAEEQLFLATMDYLERYSSPQYSFSIKLDPVYVKRNGLSFTIGDQLWVTDSALEIDRKIRITQVSRKIVEENEYTLTLSDTVSQGTLERITNNISTAQMGVQQISNQLQNGALFNGRLIVPETSDVTGMFPIYVDGNGKIYRKV